MWVKDKVHHALFVNGDIKRTFPVLKHLRLLITDEVLRLPVAGHHAGEFPAQAVDDKGVGIIFNRSHVRIHLAQILPKALLAIRIQN